MESSTRHIEWLPQPAKGNEGNGLGRRKGIGEAADLGKTGKHAIMMTNTGVQLCLLIQTPEP